MNAQKHHRNRDDHGNVNVFGDAQIHQGDIYYADKRQLEFVSGAAYDAKVQVPRACHPETRQELLGEDMAGTGKSTISYTVAKWLDDRHSSPRLGGSFFFKRGELHRASGTHFFPTIARHLSRRLPQLETLINNALTADPDICSKSLGEQFKRLLLQPLCSLQALPALPTFVIVVDILDECGDADDISTILQLLRSFEQITTVHLRLFITSRPELPIHLGFARMLPETHRDLILHELAPELVQNDISKFIRDEIYYLRDDHNRLSTLYTALPMDWPGDYVLNVLSEMVSPLFIAAATLCLFMRDSKFHPQERLHKLLQPNNSSRFSRLAQMYHSIIVQSFGLIEDPDDLKLVYNQFKLVVGSILNMQDPLPMKDLAVLLGTEAYIVDTRLRSLQSVIWVPSDLTVPIRPLHLSFGEYLCNENLSREAFYIDGAEANRVLLQKCLQLLESSEGLRENICNLPYPGILRKDITPSAIQHALTPALQYSCRYWIHHAVRAGVELLDQGCVHKFLQHYFLHWLEALSLLDMSKDAISLLQKLQLIAPTSTDSLHVSGFLADAQRFVLANRHRIATAPLQVYSSAILFAPVSSVVRQTFNTIPAWIVRRTDTLAGWDSELQRLDGHTQQITQIKFSPGGLLLASASEDLTIRLWESETGQSLGVLEGHTRSAYELAFSPDSTLLAPASSDMTVRLWNVKTGQQLVSHKLDNYSFQLQILPEGSTVTLITITGATSNKCTVRFWTVTELVEVYVEGLARGIMTACFSPDGSLLATVEASCLRLVNIASPGVSTTLLEISFCDEIHGIRFSPSGRFLACGLRGGGLEVFDVQLNLDQSTIKHLGHGDGVYSSVLEFSPENALLALAARGDTIHVWNLCEGYAVQELHRFHDRVSHLAFSFDSSLLISGSEHTNLQIWNIKDGRRLQEFYGHVYELSRVVSSPTKPMFPSGVSNTIVLRSTTMDSDGTDQGFVDDPVQQIKISADGNLVYSVTYDDSIDIYEVESGRRLKKLEGEYSHVDVPEIHSHARRFASGSYDGTVEIWEIDRDEPIWTCKGEAGHRTIVELLFSPDGASIALVDGERKIRLYESLTGKWRALEKPNVFCGSFTFSSDSKLFAARQGGDKIWIWNVDTGTILESLDLSMSLDIGIAFSRDGSPLAFMRGSCLRTWSFKTGQVKDEIQVNGSANRLKFPVDDALLTESGWLQLHGKTRSSAELSALSGIKWVVEGEWLTYCGQRLLWLPDEYRDFGTIIRGNTIAVRRRSGLVSVMKLRDPW